MIVALLLFVLAWAIQGCALGGKPDPDYAQTLEFKIWREGFPLTLLMLALFLNLCCIALWSWAMGSIVVRSIRERAGKSLKP